MDNVDISIQDVLDLLKDAVFVGNKESRIKNIISLESMHEDDSALFWCNDRNVDVLKGCRFGTVICTAQTFKKASHNNNLNFIIHDSPRLAFSKVISIFFHVKKKPIISSTAILDSSIKIGENIYVGEGVVVEKSVMIGDNCCIEHGSVIFAGTVIGNNVVIGANNVIGGNGLGYEKDENGDYQFIPHLGNVVLCDNVETGSNCAIDKAVLGSTIIGRNTKLDNFVHVAHGVKIGANCILTAKVMIAGSTQLGENVWVGPSAAIMNKITIGSDAIIGLGAVVIGDVPENAIVAGNPAKILRYKK